MAALKEQVIAVPSTLDRGSVEQLARAIEAAMQEPLVSAVVLQGSSEAFCKGLDLDELVETQSESGKFQEQSVADYCRCLRALRFADKPAIAVVEGPALGGGVGLVAASDVVIASHEASFGLPEVLFGLAPAMVLPFLLERVSVRTVRIWAMTGVARSAGEAQTAGLVDVVVPKLGLESEVNRWLKTLRRGQRQGVKTIKHLSAIIPALDVAAALELGQQSTLALLRDEGTMSAIRNFKIDGVLPWESP